MTETAPASLASRYGRQLLDALGEATTTLDSAADEHPAQGWARSGLMALTGPADGAPLLCPSPIPACADGALAALASLGNSHPLRRLRGAALLTERAALAGLSRQGAVSAGGSCRLLAAADGRVALSLARDEDWALLPAWLECAVAADWSALAEALPRYPVATLLERGHLLGLAVVADDWPHEPARPWCLVSHRAAGAASRLPDGRRRPLVVDLSALWAGPLCGHLLQQLGAQVIKVEGLHRPDGARAGPAGFFHLLNAGKASVALDLTTPRGRAQLQALLSRADIVIEASRPRALRQLGIDAETLLEQNPALTWLAISGHGRSEPAAQRIAFGDDAAVAAGASQMLYEASGKRVFVGDALADPLTGLHAALAAWSSWRAGGGRLLDVAMTAVMRQVLAFDAPADAAASRLRYQHWQQWLAAEGCVAAAPAARAASGQAAALGADTTTVLTALGIAC